MAPSSASASGFGGAELTRIDSRLTAGETPGGQGGAAPARKKTKAPLSWPESRMGLYSGSCCDLPPTCSLTRLNSSSAENPSKFIWFKPCKRALAKTEWFEAWPAESLSATGSFPRAGHHVSGLSLHQFLQVGISLNWIAKGRPCVAPQRPAYVARQHPGIATVGDHQNVASRDGTGLAGDLRGHNPAGWIVFFGVDGKPVGLVRVAVVIAMPGVVDQQVVVLMKTATVIPQGSKNLITSRIA